MFKSLFLFLHENLGSAIITETLSIFKNMVGITPLSSRVPVELLDTGLIYHL